MPTIDILVRRFNVVSKRPFEEVVQRLTTSIGRPDLKAFHEAVASATTLDELEAVVRQAVGSSDLMEFVRFDSGDVLRKERGGQGSKMLRLVVGNPLIMKEMAKAVPMPPRARPSRFSLTSALMACICHMTRWRASSLLTRMRAQPGWRKISTRRSRGYSRQPHCDAQASCFDWRVRSN